MASAFQKLGPHILLWETAILGLPGVKTLSSLVKAKIRAVGSSTSFCSDDQLLEVKPAAKKFSCDLIRVRVGPLPSQNLWNSIDCQPWFKALNIRLIFFGSWVVDLNKPSLLILIFSNRQFAASIVRQFFCCVRLSRFPASGFEMMLAFGGYTIV